MRVQNVLNVVLVICFSLLQDVSTTNNEKQPGILLCRQCGQAIVTGHDVVDIKSPLALHYKNATALGPNGMLVQTLRNPEGIHFDVITASKANIQTHGQAYAEYSWFEGFSWRMVKCPSCKTHLGWAFEPPSSHRHEEPAEKYKQSAKYSFVGLILERLIPETFADSLIITPKIYN